MGHILMWDKLAERTTWRWFSLVEILWMACSSRWISNKWKRNFRGTRIDTFVLMLHCS